MRVVPFYSFKGGAGRSHLLYSCAWLLAHRGARVVIADWDLHAPGLSLLPDLQPPEGPLVRPGVLDYLLSVVDPGDAGDGEAGDAGTIIDPASLVWPTRVAARLPPREGRPGGIWFISCGQIDAQLAELDGDPQYDAQLSRLRPRLERAARDEAVRSGVLETFADRVEAHFTEQGQPAPDYLFLDARTGLTEVGEILCNPMADPLVVVFGLNQQNIEGMARTVQKVLRDRAWTVDERMARLVLVASPVPTGEEELKTTRMAHARERLREVLLQAETDRGGLRGRTLVEPPILAVPYHPRVALSEELLAERWPESEIVRAMQVVAQRISPPQPGALEADLAAGRVRLTRTGAASEPHTGPPPTPPDRVPSPQGHHPLAHPLPWDFYSPGADPQRLLRVTGPISHEVLRRVLQGLANTLSLAAREVATILESAPRITTEQYTALAGIFDEERAKFLGLATGWTEMAQLAGRSWVHWAQALAVHLEDEPVVVLDRLVDAWPVVLADPGGAASTVAGVQAMLALEAPAWPPARRLLDRLLAAQPTHLVALALRARGAVVYDAEDPLQGAWVTALARACDAPERLWALRTTLDASAAPVQAQRALADLAVAVAEVAIPTLEAEPWAWLAVGQITLDRLQLDPTAPQLEPLRARVDHAHRVALELQPDMHEAAYNWGNALGQQARALADTQPERAQELWTQAGQCYQRALDIKPDSHEAAYNWGNALDHQARALADTQPERAQELWTQAGQRYQRALDIKPDSHEAAYNWGNALDDQARALAATQPERAQELWTQAGQRYQRALDIKPDTHEAAYNWGNALDHQARALADTQPERAQELWTQAGQRYQRALDIKPDKHEAAYNWAAALSRQHHALRAVGRADEAAQAARQALELARRAAALSGRPEYNLACALALNGEAEAALAELERVKAAGTLPAHVATDPDLASLHALPGWAAIVG